MSFSATASPIHHGFTLLEASAGTGKTYSLVRIIARHLVEHGIALDKILTVTFTRAATAEIKGRLHQLLTEILNELKKPQAAQENDLVQKWVAEGDERVNQAITTLSIALASFDSVPIFTIDGFFQRLLKEYAFESKSLFSVELDTNEAAMLDIALRDYWRSHVYSMNADDYALFSEQIKFDTASKFVSEVLRSGDAQLDPSYSKDLTTELATYRANVILLKRLLIDKYEAIRNFITTPPDGLAKRGIPFAKNKQDNFMEEISIFTEQADSASGDLGNICKISSNKIFSEAAFNKDKFTDLSTHHLAPVFQAIAAAEDSYPKNLKSALLGKIYYFVADRIQQIKADRNVQGYSDVTQKLSTLLTSQSSAANSMKNSVRHTYQAALIDEFQDTSPQQSSVFIELFNQPEGFFHIIGDPKQSIYRFRGADVYAYIKASQLANHKENLDTNFRSTPQVIHAVNKIFAMSNDPFLVDNKIEFFPSKWKDQTNPEEAPARLPEPSFNFHLLDENISNVTDMGATLRHDISKQILKLLQSSWETVAPNDPDHTGTIKPSDIAILVNSGKEGEALAKAISALNIPVATQTQTSLLNSEEASDMLYILSAVINPTHTALLRSALLTVPLGNGSRLADDASFHQSLESFALLQETWERHGLMPMMVKLIETFDVRPRLLSFSQGLRRLTNFQHIAEVLDTKARQEKLSPSDLLQWYEMAIQGAIIDTDSEVLELRLSSDSPCLKILTQHSSKGLEFPIVFVTPSCRAEFKTIKPDLAYHSDTLETIISSQESEKEYEDIYAIRTKEACADRARLAYVAVTRAKFRCHYYHNPANKKKPHEHAIHQMLGEPADEDWEKLESSSDGCIAVHHLNMEHNDVELARYEPSASTSLAELAHRSDEGAQIDLFKRTTSFTGITQPHHHFNTSHDLDEITQKRAISEDTGFWKQLQAGASLGSAFHEILEEIDFQQADNIDALIQQKLNSFQPWRITPTEAEFKTIIDGVSDNIKALLKHQLDDSTQLCQLTEKQRLTEPEFLLSGSRYSLGHLADILASSPPNGLPAGYIDQLRALEESELTGFLTGFIDLVFEHDGRYHLLDWKTNRLTDYSSNGLASAMAEHHYYLQYHLYALALDRLLQHRLGDLYDPEKHLGNTYYIFLRGVDPSVSGSGVFTDHIDIDRLHALRSAFTPSLV